MDVIDYKKGASLFVKQNRIKLNLFIRGILFFDFNGVQNILTK